MAEPTAAEPKPTFEIGLVMAGAISAGAYTAGVLDFLIQALDAWEAEKESARNNSNEDWARKCPMHNVKLRVMAGSSAGGMTAGLAAGLLGMRFDSVPEQPKDDKKAEPANNTLYRSWVNMIDIGPLLESRDLDENPGRDVQSILDSTILRDIADKAFEFEHPDRTAKRAYVADPLEVFLTVTNLRGVPYKPDFINFHRSAKEAGPALLPYEMTMHADHMHFILGAKDPKNPAAFWLDSNKVDGSDAWNSLKDAALATGAFPVGLAPRVLKRPPSQYAARQWLVPGPYDADGHHSCERWTSIGPAWPAIDNAVADGEKAGTPWHYEFLTVDGGVMNNEPLDFARRVLHGPNGTESTAGDTATRAVIMILPFPNGGNEFPVDYDSGFNVLNLLTTTFNSLISQARFKPEELSLANDPEVYSRFLVVPRRGYQNGQPEANTIACGSLGGFGGFLSRRFREHDYQLGRRNCQWFLQHYFVLPERNPVVAGWEKDAVDAHAVLKAGRGGLNDGKHTVLPLRPIIPLYGSAKETIPETEWPSITENELGAIEKKVRKRLGRLGNILIGRTIGGWVWGPFARVALKAGWWFQKRKAAKVVMKKIRTDLAGRNLLSHE